MHTHTSYFSPGIPALTTGAHQVLWTKLLEWNVFLSPLPTWDTPLERISLRVPSHCCHQHNVSHIVQSNIGINKKHVAGWTPAPLPQLAITAEEKNEATKILTVDFMSSEETGQESAGSDNEWAPPVTIFKILPLPWQSDRANSIIASMDRKAQRRSSDRAKEMCRKRYNGDPSTRWPPPSAPQLAVLALVWHCVYMYA